MQAKSPSNEKREKAFFLLSPLQERSLLEVSKVGYFLLNKMLCQQCRVQSIPADHQNEVLDTESVGGRTAGRELM